MLTFNASALSGQSASIHAPASSSVSELKMQLREALGISSTVVLWLTVQADMLAPDGASLMDLACLKDLAPGSIVELTVVTGQPPLKVKRYAYREEWNGQKSIYMLGLVDEIELDPCASLFDQRSIIIPPRDDAPDTRPYSSRLADATIHDDRNGDRPCGRWGYELPQDPGPPMIPNLVLGGELSLRTAGEIFGDGHKYLVFSPP